MIVRADEKIDRLGEGGADGLRSVDLLGPSDRSGDEDAAHARGARRLHIGPDVSDVDHRRRVEPELVCGSEQHARPRLPALTSALVGAHLPQLERAEQLLDSRIDRIRLCSREAAEGDARLVCHDPERNAERAQPVEGLTRPWHGDDKIRIAVVRHVDDEGIVSIEKDGVWKERPMKSMLVLRALKIGDLLVSVPALRGLRRAFPEHRIILACPDWLRPLAGLTGCVDDILPTSGLEPLDFQGPVDIAVNLHGKGPESHALLDELNPRLRIGHWAPGWDGPEWVEEMHERDRWVRLLSHVGVPADSSDLRLPVPDVDVSRFGGGSGSVVIHPGAAYPSRHWPVDRFAAVAAHAASQGKTVLLTGDEGERPRAEAVRSLAPRGVRVVAGRTSLLDYAALIAHADLVISADTGAAHLASAFGRPSVILFGPAPPEQWGPPPGPHRVLTAAHLRRGDLFAQTPDPALLAVSVDDVTRHLDALGAQA